MLTSPCGRASYTGKKAFENQEYFTRIKKSLYYVHLPKTYCTSLPCTELAAEIFSGINKFSLDQLDIEEAANLSHNACVSPCSLVLALLYLDRLKSMNPKYLTKVSPSELFLISLMVGSKFLQDDGEEDEVNNFEWAASAGIDVQDINKAEKEFLNAIKWEVFVSENEFWERFHILERKLSLRQGSRRGWFTYTELYLLLELIDIATVVEAFCTVTAACLTSYTASMLTLLGSTLLIGQITGLGLKPKVQEVDNSQNWSNLSSFNFTTDFSMEKKLEDCHSTSTSILLQFDLDNELNFCRDLNNLNNEISDCVEWNTFNSFLRRTANKEHEVEHSLISDFPDRSGIEVFYGCNNIWRWVDSVRNYFLINSVPNTLFSIANV